MYTHAFNTYTHTNLKICAYMCKHTCIGKYTRTHTNM